MTIGIFQNRSELALAPTAAIDELLQRLKGLCPREMAEALCVLELHHSFPHKVTSFNSHSPGETSIYFSRGMKQEIQSIYAELARHLRAHSQDAHELMDRLFELFDETMRFLAQSPLLVSSN